MESQVSFGHLGLRLATFCTCAKWWLASLYLIKLNRVLMTYVFFSSLPGDSIFVPKFLILDPKSVTNFVPWSHKYGEVWSLISQETVVPDSMVGDPWSRYCDPRSQPFDPPARAALSQRKITTARDLPSPPAARMTTNMFDLSPRTSGTMIIFREVESPVQVKYRFWNRGLAESMTQAGIRCDVIGH